MPKYELEKDGIQKVSLSFIFTADTFRPDKTKASVPACIKGAEGAFWEEPKLKPYFIWVLGKARRGVGFFWLSSFYVGVLRIVKGNSCH